MRYLYHSTTQVNAINIMTCGFDPRVYATGGQYTYFTEEPTYLYGEVCLVVDMGGMCISPISDHEYVSPDIISPERISIFDECDL